MPFTTGNNSRNRLLSASRPEKGARLAGNLRQGAPGVRAGGWRSSTRANGDGSSRSCRSMISRAKAACRSRGDRHQEGSRPMACQQGWERGARRDARGDSSGCVDGPVSRCTGQCVARRTASAAGPVHEDRAGQKGHSAAADGARTSFATPSSRAGGSGMPAGAGGCARRSKPKLLGPLAGGADPEAILGCARPLGRVADRGDGPGTGGHAVLPDKLGREVVARQGRSPPRPATASDFTEGGVKWKRTFRQTAAWRTKPCAQAGGRFLQSAVGAGLALGLIGRAVSGEPTGSAGCESAWIGTDGHTGVILGAIPRGRGSNWPRLQKVFPDDDDAAFAATRLSAKRQPRLRRIRADAGKGGVGRRRGLSCLTIATPKRRWPPLEKYPHRFRKAGGHDPGESGGFEEAVAIGRRLTSLMNMRCFPYRAARKAVEDGLVGGEPILLTSQKSYKFGGGRPWFYKDLKTYGGTIPWAGIHSIDYMLTLVGNTSGVSAWHGNRPSNTPAFRITPACSSISTTAGRR